MAPAAGASRPLRAVVFDLDGTLVDSAPGIAAALAALSRAPRPVDVSRVRRLVALGAEALVKDVLALSDEAVPAALAAFRRVYAQAPCRPDDLYPGARAALAGLRRRGMGIGVCTNKPQRLAEVVLDRLGIADLVDVVVGASPERPEKPAPDMLTAVLARLGAGADALYVGDTEIDAETARRAGIRFVAATFGYGTFAPAPGRFASLACLQDLAAIVSRACEPAA